MLTGKENKDGGGGTGTPVKWPKNNWFLGIGDLEKENSGALCSEGKLPETWGQGRKGEALPRFQRTNTICKI